MKYLDAVESIKKLESDYDLSIIKLKGVSVWPLLRINLIDRLCDRDETMKTNGGSAVKLVLHTLFAYNPFKLFGRHKIWLFAGYERRKRVGNNNILRISGGVVEAAPSTLVIEKPSALQLQGKNGRVSEKHIVSESWMLLIVHLLATLNRVFGVIHIENEKLLKDVLHELNVTFDYHSSLRILLAQKGVSNCLLRMCHRPEKVIIECPYPVMGYVWAFHQHGIPVIEMQHGVLNKQHYAYCSKYHSDVLYPDEIWCFGEDEYNYLTSEECHYCSKVEKIGLYFLEVTDKFFKSDPFEKERRLYKYIVLVAGQRGYEKDLASFTDEVACKEKDSLFVYVPRTLDEKVEFTQDNVVYRPGVNIYQYMKWCDLHLTISSTTVLECQYFRKPTIFYDYEKLGSTYYGEVLTEKNAIWYVNAPHEFGGAFKALTDGEYHYKECFTAGTVEKIMKLLNIKS